MAVRVTNTVVISTLLFCLFACSPQFGDVVVTNGTNRTISEIRVDIPDLNSDFNRRAGVVMVGTLAAGEVIRVQTKGLPHGAFSISWTEPDGKVVNLEDSLGETRLSTVKIVIQEDGTIRIERIDK